ncbi:MAG: glycosyltransferase, partial [Candidatus Cloacimonetes bacterium]|nr:glycosyltransferase [Candidatus Cloacimonadota bacterium]
MAKKQSKEPLISVIAIAHNEEKRILSCLWSLADNSCTDPIEIIVVNNNSTDRTTEVLDAVGIPWLDEKKKGPGFARQCGLD